MKPLSEQLADLSKHAKAAEDDAAAAQKEARTAVQARVEKLQADAAARGARLDQATKSAKSDVADRWTAMRSQVRAGIEGIKADLATKKAERDAGRAERTADSAEYDAAVAIAFAYDAIDYADAAVLDAVIARSDADAAG